MHALLYSALWEGLEIWATVLSTLDKHLSAGLHLQQQLCNMNTQSYKMESHTVYLMCQAYFTEHVLKVHLCAYVGLVSLPIHSWVRGGCFTCHNADMNVGT